MRRVSRLLILSGGVIAGVLLGIAIMTSLWLRTWVPTQGKAWLETQLEEQLPLDVRIGTMRYSFWNGLRLEDVQGIDRLTRATWVRVPHVQAHVNLLSLALGLQAVFHLKAAMTVPVETDVAISGRYAIRTHQLTLDLLSSDIPIGRMSPLLAQRFPAFKDGSARVMLQASWLSGSEPFLRGRITGTKIVWEREPVQFTGNVRVEGTIASTPHGPRPWSVDATMKIDHGLIEGLPFLKQADEVSGAARLIDDTIHIKMLQGKTFGSPWRVEGTIGPLAEPRLEAFFRSQASVAMLANQMLNQFKPWQPAGEVDIALVCRGPLTRWSHPLAFAANGSASPSPTTGLPTTGKEIGPTGQSQGVGWPDLEIMATADLRDVSLTIPKWPHRLEHLTGRLTYDHLTQRLTIQSVKGRITYHARTGVVVIQTPSAVWALPPGAHARDSPSPSTGHHGLPPLNTFREAECMDSDPVALEGTVQLVTPPVWDLKGQTTTDLGILRELLPSDGPIQSLSGRASVRLSLQGTAAQPRWEGEADLTDARALLQEVSSPIEGLSGVIRFSNEEVSSPRLSFTIAGEPILLAGAVTDLGASPRIISQARLTASSLTLNGTLHPDRFLLDEGDVTIGSSSLHAQGYVSRSPAQASQLTVQGTVNLSDLSRIPWVQKPELSAWQLDGDTRLQLRLLGPLGDWRTIQMRGSLRAERMAIRGVPVRTLSAEFEQGQGRLAIRLMQAMVAGGRLVGDFRIQRRLQPARYLLELALTRADLAQVGAAIPPWQQRRIQGSASASASLSGFWRDRASARGEGWIYLSGEQLVELPLLDRLFVGIFGALADRLGLATLRKAQLTKFAGQWRLSQERISTDDLQLVGVSGTEPISIMLRGSVGLDKTLDLVVEPELSDQLILQAPNTSTVSKTILQVVGGLERLRRLIGRHHVGGTIESPHYTFELTIDQLLPQLFPSVFGQLLESVH